ncbi:hypothetical protein ACQZV8_03935 [Magnetococcales bacterium HHB-1]
MTSTLLHVAQKAWDHIPFYKKTLLKRPQCVAEIPFFSESDFFNTQGLLDCIADQEEIAWTILPWSRYGKRFPWGVVESEADQHWRQQRITQMLAALNIAEEAKDRRFLIISDETRGPLACEISTALAWERQQASILYWHGDRESFRQSFCCFSADFVIVLIPLPSTLVSQIRDQRATWIFFARVETPLSLQSSDWSWLSADILPLFAFRHPHEQVWYLDDQQFFWETHPVTGYTHITTLQAEMFPLIRFSLGQSIPLTAID